MSQSEPIGELDALRRDIDQIDLQIHDLIMRRAAMVERIASAKRVGPENAIRAVLRPGREAIILRRLLARHEGRFPRDAVARIWREIITGLCRLQGPLSIAVLATEKSVGYTDLARNHYGSGTPLSLFRSASRVLRQVAEGSGTVGVLPAPEEGEAEPWWPQLSEGEGELPRVIAKLPFTTQGAGQMEALSAFAVALADPEPSGNDESLVSLLLHAPVSRARVAEALARAGFVGRMLAAHQPASGLERQLHAVEGFVPADDPRLGQLVEGAQGAVARAKVLGAYAVPIAE